MRLDRRARRWLQASNSLFTFLLVGVVALAAAVTATWRYRSDWTAGERHSLSPESRRIAQRLEEPVRIQAFMAPEPRQRARLRELLERYRRAGAPLEIEFVNPEIHPQRVRELGIRGGGEVLLRSGEREQRLRRISEAKVTNALSRLARDSDRWVVFLAGHGERAPDGAAPFDLGELGERLRARGFSVQRLELAEVARLPANADLVVLASPQKPYWPGERERLREYVAAGGHLLWLMEPEGDPGLDTLAADVGINRLPGVVADPAAELFDSERLDFAVVHDLGEHAVTRGLESAILLPRAGALQTAPDSDWALTSLLRSRERAWTETGALAGDNDAQFDAATAEVDGPLTLAVAAQRPAPDGSGEQRIAVIGDGDFASNAFVDEGANGAFAERLFAWTLGDGERIALTEGPRGTTPEALSRTQLAIWGATFALGLPLLLLTGAWWALLWRRRH